MTRQRLGCDLCKQDRPTHYYTPIGNAPQLWLCEPCLNALTTWPDDKPDDKKELDRRFKFEIGQLVVTKADLAVTTHHHKATGGWPSVHPVQIVGRYWFESAQAIEEVYHIIHHGQVFRHMVEELADARELFALWMELKQCCDVCKYDRPTFRYTSPAKEAPKIWICERCLEILTTWPKKGGDDEQSSANN